MQVQGENEKQESAGLRQVELVRDITKIREWHRTARVAVIAIALLLFAWLAVWAADKILDRLAKYNGALLGAGVVSVVAPTMYATLFLKMRVRCFTKNHMGRTIELETMIDSKRTSSGLQVDGSTPEHLK